MAKKEKVVVKKGVSLAKKPDAATSDSVGKSKKGVKERSKGKGKWHGGTVGDDLDVELAALGLRIKDITGDGNCFFRALGDQLEGDEGAHVRLRHAIMLYIQQHEEDFAPFVEDDESFGTYVARMKKDGVWAGYMEVVAASRCLGANLTIYQAGQPRWRVINHPEDAAPMLHLSYHDGQHYNSMRCADDYGTGPPAPVVIRGDGTIAARPQRQGGDGGWDEKDERRVAASTACTDLGLVRRALEEAGGDVEAAIERVIEALAAAETEDAEASEAGPAEAAAVPGARETPEGERDPVAAGSVACEGSGRADGPSIRAEAAGQQPCVQRRPQQEHATAVAAAVVEEHVDTASAAAAAAPTTGASKEPGGAVEDVPAADLDGLAVADGGGAEGSGGSATAGATAASGQDAGPPAADGTKEASAAAAEATAGSKKAPNGTSKKPAPPRRKAEGRKGVGAVSNNKPCPCGSNKKYKACCGPAAAAAERRRAATAGEGAATGPASGSSPSTNCVVAQMASLVI